MLEIRKRLERIFEHRIHLTAGVEVTLLINKLLPPRFRLTVPFVNRIGLRAGQKHRKYRIDALGPDGYFLHVGAEFAAYGDIVEAVYGNLGKHMFVEGEESFTEDIAGRVF
jgi:hypothetical protein